MYRIALFLSWSITFCLAACAPLPSPAIGPTDLSSSATENGGAREPVIFVQGGAIDDTVSYLLLTTMETIDLLGVIVTNADTIADHAMQVQWKTAGYIEDTKLPIGLSAARGWNPFPWSYRTDAISQANVPIYNSLKENPEWPPFSSGDRLLHDLLSDAVRQKSPVTLLITAPPTALSDLLRASPDLEAGIARLIWMGGAIHVKGNLDPNTIPAEVANPQAEWNAFWDPQGVDWLFDNTDFPIVLFPLDVTNQVPVSDRFMKTIETQAADYRYSDLVHQSYLLTSDEPYYEMWNTVATAYLAHPEFFTEPEVMALAIETEGYDQGTIQESADGRQVDVVLDIVDKDGFYDYVLGQFRRDYAHSQSADGP